MNILFHVIFGIACIPIWPILYFQMRNQAKPKKNLIIGATLPQSVHEDVAVLQALKKYKKWLNITMLPLLPLLFPVFLMSTSGAVLTWYMTWILLVIVLPNVVIATYREKLMALKRDNAWYSEAASVVIADIKAAAQSPRKVSGIWFLIPLVLSIAPVAHALIEPPAWGLAFVVVYVTNALMVALFWLMYHFIFRVRSEVVNENLTLTMTLTRMRRYKWSRLWLVAAWLTCGLSLSTWAFSGNVAAFILLILVYTVIIMIIAIHTEFSARFAQQKLTSDESGDLYVDEDDHWIWGLLYYNPSDNNFLVNNRIGINMSFNLARPAAKWIMLISALIIVAMPFLGVWMWVQETTPARLVLSETELIARHTRDRYVIRLDSIESIELIDRLPFTSHRINGGDFENLSVGIFSVPSVGRAYFCLHPKNPPILHITAGGQHYFLNDSDTSVTQDIYLRLTLSSNLKKQNYMEYWGYQQ